MEFLYTVPQNTTKHLLYQTTLDFTLDQLSFLCIGEWLPLPVSLWFWTCNIPTLLFHKPVESSAIWMTRVVAHFVRAHLWADFSACPPWHQQKFCLWGWQAYIKETSCLLLSISRNERRCICLYTTKICTCALPMLLRTYCMHCTWYLELCFF